MMSRPNVKLDDFAPIVIGPQINNFVFRL